MKIKDIEIGKFYTDKKKNSIRQVVFIEGTKLKFKLIQGRYKSNIGKESFWDIDRFAKWASNVCNENGNFTNIEEFLKNPIEGISLRLKDEFTLEDFFKLDGIDSDIKDFSINDFKCAKSGAFSSIEYDEYDIIIKNGAFPCSSEEVKKYFELA